MFMAGSVTLDTRAMTPTPTPPTPPPPGKETAPGANDALIVGAPGFSGDAYRLLELNADVEQAIKAGSRCVRRHPTPAQRTVPETDLTGVMPCARVSGS
jgi:hypothetical protein